MNCENPKCNHTQEDHMQGEFNCTRVIEKIYSKDKKDFGTLAAKVPAIRLCPCMKFIYPDEPKNS